MRLDDRALADVPGEVGAATRAMVLEESTWPLRKVTTTLSEQVSAGAVGVKRCGTGRRVTSIMSASGARPIVYAVTVS